MTRFVKKNPTKMANPPKPEKRVYLNQSLANKNSVKSKI